MIVEGCGRSGSEQGVINGSRTDPCGFTDVCGLVVQTYDT
jgi:hypothetical protein